MIKELCIAIFILIFSQLKGQEYSILTTLDTTVVNHDVSNYTSRNSMFDTIIYYKEKMIDTIIQRHPNDTVFFVKYFDKGWRYVDDTLHDTSIRQQKNGYILNGKKVGLWDPDVCQQFGECVIARPLPLLYTYYNGVKIDFEFKDKYFYLSDTLSGDINVAGCTVDSIAESLSFICIKDKNEISNCTICLNDETEFISVPLDDLMSEIYLLQSGYYNRMIKTLLGKHKH